MNKLESDIESKACKIIKDRLKIKSLKIKKGSFDGLPDRIFFLPNATSVFIEFKRPNEKPRPRQEKVIRDLRKLGFHVLVCDSVLEAIEFIESFLHKSHLDSLLKEHKLRADILHNIQAPADIQAKLLGDSLGVKIRVEDLDVVRAEILRNSKKY